jgi:LysR family transcriptional activator of nhaA
MRNWINYHHLLYFKTIAEHGSVSKAADLLRLGQPTLSAQLKQFEETMGVQLFHREGKKLVLSEHGKVALEYAKDIFSKGGELYQVLHSPSGERKSLFRLGAIDGIAKQILSSLAQEARKLEDCRVIISEGKPLDLMRELEAGKIDMAITNFIPEGIDSRVIGHRILSKKPVSIYGAPSLKYLRKDFPKSISGHPVILPTYDSKLRYDVENWGRIKRVMFNVIVESQDIGLKKLMAIEGVGLIPAASHTIMRQVLQGELIEIGKLESVYESVYMLYWITKKKKDVIEHLLRTAEL